MPTEIRLVTDPEEKEAIYRFRYDVYVTEMNRPQRYADHQGKRIVDELDDVSAKLYGAWNAKGEVVGTVRSNYLRNSNIGGYFSLYCLNRLSSSEIESASITTRLMIRSDYRRTSLSIDIAKMTYEQGLIDGITTDFIDCNQHLINYFKGFGYKVHQDGVVHPDYGTISVMRLELRDLSYLGLTGSPFESICEKKGAVISSSNKTISEISVNAP